MNHEKEYREIAQLIRKANWILLDAEHKYRQIVAGSSVSNDIFRKRLDDAEIATARAHNEFAAYIEKNPNISSSTEVPLSFFPGEAANMSEALLAIDLLKAQSAEERI